MAAQYYLGIDQGSTGTTAILFDSTWHVVSRGYSNIHLFYPRDGWVEHDAEEVWQSVQRAVAQALRAPAIQPAQIRSIGLNHANSTRSVTDVIDGPCVAIAILGLISTQPSEAALSLLRSSVQRIILL